MFGHLLPIDKLMMIYVHSVTYSVHKPPSNNFLYTNINFVLLPLFSELFCTRTTLWWPILYTNINLVTYSVYAPSPGNLIDIQLTFGLPSVYTPSYSMHQNKFGTLLCTRTDLCWSILYTITHLLNPFCMRTYLFCTTMHSRIPLLTYSIGQHLFNCLLCTCTFGNPILYSKIHLMTYSVHAHPSCDQFYALTLIWWLILHTHLSLVTCFIHQY